MHGLLFRISMGCEPPSLISRCINPINLSPLIPTALGFAEIRGFHAGERRKMDETPNLRLPYLAAAQAQKHVTHNEAIRALDAVIQIAVISKDTASPPASPADGDRYIVAPPPSGDWSGHDGNIAAFQDGAWMFYEPRKGWLAWVEDESRFHVHDGAAWSALSVGGIGSGAAVLNAASNGAETAFHLLEEELTLSGSYTQSTIQIPDRAIVFAVGTRTTQAITGAASYDCGIAGEPGKYGSALSVAAGSTNSGVTGPTAFYADTPVRISANGGDFTAGKVRVCIHYMLCTVPAS